MASINELEYTKDWTDRDDFPTKEYAESQVRADIQYLFDEIRSYINTTLVPLLGQHSDQIAKLGGGGEVGHDTIADNAIQENNILDGSVTTEKIAEGSITPDRFDDMEVSSYVEDIATEVIQTSGVTGVKGSSEEVYRRGDVEITKASIGLENVDNTSDANKPISTATQTALNKKAPLASPEFTGSPTAPTPSSSSNGTRIATTEYCNDNFAPLASPTFSGSPKAPTPSTSDNSTRLATTAFVQSVASGASGDLSGYAPIDSPEFTGSPTAPTPSSSSNSTRIATTEFVQSLVSGGGSSSSAGISRASYADISVPASSSSSTQQASASFSFSSLGVTSSTVHSKVIVQVIQTSGGGMMYSYCTLNTSELVVHVANTSTAAITARANVFVID